jgi:hypothetical protein
VWHVVGLQRSIREWAKRQGWSGRPVRIQQAQVILVAGLGDAGGAYWLWRNPSLSGEESGQCVDIGFTPM